VISANRSYDRSVYRQTPGAADHDRTRSYWDANQPGVRFAEAQPGTQEFFAEVEKTRYQIEPHIPEVVGFARWANRDVLEAGCGIATDGVCFARAGARYTGLDQSSDAIQLARRRFTLEGLPGGLVQGTVTALPFEDASFDLVYSHGVIHHIEETERAVSEFHRVLRPGGVALVMVYHRGSLNYWVTIMGIRRLLAAALLVPGAPAGIARLTGESVLTLEGHRQLLKTHRLGYLTNRQLFLSHNTDGPGNPLSQAYSRQELRQLFAEFAETRLTTRHLNLRIYPGGSRLARTARLRALERRFGWHIYVEARKHADASD
jgi:SAM-dependent methyltransferase